MKTPLHLTVTIALAFMAATGSRARPEEPAPVTRTSPRQTIEPRDLDAIDWLLSGMIHGLGQDDSAQARNLVADWRRQVAAIRHAHATADPQLPRMVKRFVQETATPVVHGLSGGRPVYLLLGFHGAQLFEGDAYGYFEFDSPRLAADRIVQILALSEKCAVPVNLEFGLSSLRILCQRDPELKAALARAVAAGRAEIVNSAFALPYGHLNRPESNLRQFEVGARVYRELTGGRPRVYAFSEYSAFPQLPQILGYFGIPYASLRGRFGCGPSTPQPLIVWEGRDGTRVRALTHQTNTFSGEYYGMRFYQELFALLIQAGSGLPRDYAVYNSLEDHPLVFACDHTEDAMRLSRFGDVLGHHLTYAELFENGPAPCGIFTFPYDQYGLHRVPERAERQNGLGHKVQLATAELERSLLRVEGLVAHAQMSGKDVAPLAAELEATWETLLACQSHDCAECPCHWHGKYSRDRLALFPQDEQNIISAIPEQRSTMIGRRALDLLGPAVERVRAVESRALALLGLNRPPATAQRVHFNPQSFAVDGMPPGFSPAGPELAAASAWHATVEAGALVLTGPAGLRLAVRVADEADHTSPVQAEAGSVDRFVAAAGITIRVAPRGERLILQCESRINGLKLRLTGFRPGSEAWCNYPMGTEPTRTREITTTDLVWVRGAFMIVSDANHYYSCDLERSELTDVLWDLGRYDLTIVPDRGMDVAAAGRELARFEVPPVEYTGEVPATPGLPIASGSIHLQALIPGKDGVRLRVLNYSDQAAAAAVTLPQGWRLNAQVDACGTPYHEQPRGNQIRLGPWSFGTFLIAREP